MTQIKPKKIRFQIQFFDLLNKPYTNIYHEVKISGDKYAISSGKANGSGKGVVISRPVGTVLIITVEHPITKERLEIPQCFIVPEQNGILRIQAPFFIQKVPLQEHEGTAGDYTRSFHKIKKGETLDSIAQKYGTTWQILHRLNKEKIPDANRIMLNTYIRIPPESSGLRNQQSNNNSKITTSEYTVQKGDTLSKIAERSGKNVAEIGRINKIRNTNQIRVGDKLKLTSENENKSQEPQEISNSSNPSRHSDNPSSSTPSQEDKAWYEEALDTAGEFVESGLETAEEARQSAIGAVTDIMENAGNEIKKAQENLGDVFDSVFSEEEILNETTERKTETPTPTSQTYPIKSGDVQTSTQAERGQGGEPKFVTSKQGNCFCNRDLALSELKGIVKDLRGSYNVSSIVLWNHKRCILDENERNYESLLTELNKTFKKYDVNTCLRKIHFLAQSYQETGGFLSTVEYADGTKYDPVGHDKAKAIKNGNTKIGDGPKYRGRGLMHLTWKDNYELYKNYSGIDIVSNYERVSRSLIVAADTAGWFWTQGKVLSNTQRWTGPRKEDQPNFIKDEVIDYPKKRVNDKYSTVDMNLIADDDVVDLLSFLVNGGSNGLDNRRKNVKTLKTIFGYPNQCVSTGLVKPPVETNIKAETPWMEVAIREGKQWNKKVESNISDNYFELIDIDDDNYRSLIGNDRKWCAAFVSYCLKDGNYPMITTSNPYDRMRAKAYPKDPTNFKKIDTPVYGAIAVTKKGSHVGLVIGTNGNKFYRIGGNQNNKITVNDRSFSSHEYYIPMKYWEQLSQLKPAPQTSLSDLAKQGLLYEDSNRTT